MAVEQQTPAQMELQLLVTELVETALRHQSADRLYLMQVGEAVVGTALALIQAHWVEQVAVEQVEMVAQTQMVRLEPQIPGVVAVVAEEKLGS